MSESKVEYFRIINDKDLVVFYEDGTHIVIDLCAWLGLKMKGEKDNESNFNEH